MWRDGEGKRMLARNHRFWAFDVARVHWQGKLQALRAKRSTGPPAAQVSAGAQSWIRLGSGGRNDRGALKRGDDRLRRELGLAGAMEQHPPFEGAGTHERE